MNSAMEKETARTGRGVLACGILFLIVLTALCYPSYYSQADSGCYVSMANVFARGQVSGEGLDLNLYRFTEVHGRLVGMHDAGFAMLLAPFTFFGDRACFALNLLLFLASFIIFHRALGKLGIHPAFSLLYLLHPTLWYHSRHLTSDFASGAFFLFAFYGLLVGGRARILSGVCFGLSVLVRPASAVYVAPFLAAWFLLALARPEGAGRRGAWKGAGFIALGAVPVVAVLLAYNVGVLHSVSGFIPSRVPTGAHSFALGNVPYNLLRYGVALNVVFPLLIVAFFFYKGPLRWPMFASVALGGTFYMTYIDWGLGGPVAFGGAESIILGPRYFDVVLPVMLLAYASVLSGLLARHPRLLPAARIAGVAATALLAVGVVAITIVHQRHLDQAACFRDLLFDNTPKDSVVLMDEVVRTRISGDVMHPRRLMAVFPLGADRDAERKSLDDILARRGEVYVPLLDVGREMKVDPAAARDREEFIRDHAGRQVLDVEKKGWRLRIIRVIASGAVPA